MFYALPYFPLPSDRVQGSFRSDASSYPFRKDPPLPRNISREAWMEYQHQSRVRKPARTEHGLPKHPVNDVIECPDCEGAGEHTVNHTHNNDPQYDEPVECERCGGDGYIPDGVIDPLTRIRHERIRYRRGSPLAYRRYLVAGNYAYGVSNYRKLPFIGEKK